MLGLGAVCLVVYQLVVGKLLASGRFSLLGRAAKDAAIVPSSEESCEYDPEGGAGRMRGGGRRVEHAEGLDEAEEAAKRERTLDMD